MFDIWIYFESIGKPLSGFKQRSNVWSGLLEIPWLLSRDTWQGEGAVLELKNLNLVQLNTWEETGLKENAIALEMKNTCHLIGYLGWLVDS